MIGGAWTEQANMQKQPGSACNSCASHAWKSLNDVMRQQPRLVIFMFGNRSP
jgi:hypothetical protein